MRKPIVAGMFYEEAEAKLRKQIESCFKDKKFGPGELPSGKKRIFAAISPHAGYQFSGPCQAFSYKEITETDADLFVILGTAHTGYKGAALTTEDFETPLGIVRVDTDFARALITKGLVKNDPKPHAQEHSIEVQLPFLQFIKKDFKILPIVIGEEAEFEKLGTAIAGYIKQLNKKAVIICSSDFTHYGVSYGYLPFYDNVKKNLEELDAKAIKFIENLDAEGFLSYVTETKATICGEFAIATWIYACKSFEKPKVELLKYYSSGDVVNDYSNCVGYASIIVK